MCAAAGWCERASDLLRTMPLASANLHPRRPSPASQPKLKQGRFNGRVDGHGKPSGGEGIAQLPRHHELLLPVPVGSEPLAKIDDWHRNRGLVVTRRPCCDSRRGVQHLGHRKKLSQWRNRSSYILYMLSPRGVIGIVLLSAATAQQPAEMPDPSVQAGPGMV